MLTSNEIMSYNCACSVTFFWNIFRLFCVPCPGLT